MRCRALSDPKAEGGSWSESPWDQELEGTVALWGRTVSGAHLTSVWGKDRRGTDGHREAGRGLVRPQWPGAGGTGHRLSREGVRACASVHASRGHCDPSPQGSTCVL